MRKTKFRKLIIMEGQLQLVSGSTGESVGNTNPANPVPHAAFTALRERAARIEAAILAAIAGAREKPGWLEITISETGTIVNVAKQNYDRSVYLDPADQALAAAVRDAVEK